MKVIQGNADKQAHQFLAYQCTYHFLCAEESETRADRPRESRWLFLVGVLPLARRRELASATDEQGCYRLTARLA